MGNFLENIMGSDVAKQLINTAQQQLKNTNLDDTLKKVGANKEMLSGLQAKMGNSQGNLGKLAQGVINVIGLASKAADKQKE